MKPCPKPPPREKKPRKRIASRRKKFSGNFWQKQRRIVSKVQDGKCASCGDKRLTVAHIQPIQRKAFGGRHNPDHPLNQLTNLIGLCSGPGSNLCHDAFDRLPVEERLWWGWQLKEKYEWPHEADRSRTVSTGEKDDRRHPE